MNGNNENGQTYKADISFYAEEGKKIDVGKILTVTAGITRNYFINEKKDDECRVSFFIDAEDKEEFGLKVRTLIFASQYVTRNYFINERGVA